MSHTLLFGIGNPLRGDDGIGPHLAARLQDALREPRVQCVPVHQLLPEHLLLLETARRVLFVDAAIGDTPGRVVFAPLTPAPRALLAGHELDPAGLLAMARDLYGASPEAALLTIDGGDFGFRTGFSAPVRRARREAIRHIRAWLGR